MKEEFFAWARKRNIFSETNPNEDVMGLLWLAWQRAWNEAIANQRPMVEKLKMERYAYEMEYLRVLNQKSQEKLEEESA